MQVQIRVGFVPSKAGYAPIGKKYIDRVKVGIRSFQMVVCVENQSAITSQEMMSISVALRSHQTIGAAFVMPMNWQYGRSIDGIIG